MAAVTSGSFSTTKYEVRYLRFSWSIVSQSIEDNTTTISWSLYGAGSDPGIYYKSGNFKVVIDGHTVYSSSTRIELYGNTRVASGRYTLTHDEAGAKTFSASAEAGIYYSAVNSRGSGRWELPTIPRYATVSQSLQSKTETSVTISWSSDKVIDYIWYSSNGGSSWTGVDIADASSGSYAISGLAANTAYNVVTRVRSKDSQLTTDSDVLAVTTYAFPYANSMPNFIVGDALTVGLYNPLNRAVTVVMLGNNGAQIASYSISGTSVKGFNTTAQQNALYNSIPNATRGQYTIRVTYSSHTTDKSGGTYSINTSICLPSIGTVAYQDTNSTVTEITGNNQNIVRNRSTVRYTANGLAAQKGASVAGCSVTVNGISYALTVSGSTATGGNASIDSAMSVDAVFTVRDSRGLTASKTIKVTIYDWALPTALITLHRQDNYYTTTYLTVDARYSSVDGKNACTITYKAKKSADSAWTLSGTLQDNVTTSLQMDNTSAWDVEITLVDSFNGRTVYNVVLSRGMPIIYFDRIKSSVGVNCFPKDALSLEVNGKNMENLNSDTIPKSANLNSLTTPHLYYGDSSDGYTNSPVTGGGVSFMLAVVAIGGQGQLMQRIITCNKTSPAMYMRFYYGNAWGSWLTK